MLLVESVSIQHTLSILGRLFRLPFNEDAALNNSLDAEPNYSYLAATIDRLGKEHLVSIGFRSRGDTTDNLGNDSFQLGHALGSNNRNTENDGAHLLILFS